MAVLLFHNVIMVLSVWSLLSAYVAYTKPYFEEILIKFIHQQASVESVTLKYTTFPKLNAYPR